MCSIWGGFLSLASILDFQHCTDEAQKAETVLSAVSKIIIIIIIINIIIIIIIIIIICHELIQTYAN